MARSAPAGRRAAASALACLAAAALALGPGAGIATAAPAQIDCVVNPNAPECQEQPTTTLAPTTTEPVDPSPTTTEPEATTTTAPAAVAPTATTSPPTTARPVPTTAAPVETTTTEAATTLTTRSNLLLPGDGTEGAESTTTTVRTETRVQGGSGPSDGTLIALIIGGLVVVAALVGALTFRYWRATAPEPPPGRETEASAGAGAGAARGSAVTTPPSSPAGARGAPAP
jgi:hypothetical protein